MSRIGFIQPFGISSPGGGSRILRALAHGAPCQILSIATQPSSPPQAVGFEEVHVPIRPHFGRIEKTRVAHWFAATNGIFAAGFRSRLTQVISDNRLDAIHCTAHSTDCLEAFTVAQKLQLPYFLSIHDDLAYALQDQVGLSKVLPKIATLWNHATARYVISREMGEEYCQRYGKQMYSLISDGIEAVSTTPKRIPSHKLRVYFMGLFHLSYIPNMQSLLDALDLFAKHNPHYEVTMTCRCGTLPNLRLPQQVELRLLPFSSESEVAKDMESADILYLPLPFSEAHKALARFSLSTKMITYLGSGILILYHGPSWSAASKLLTRSHAAVCVNDLDCVHIESVLMQSVKTDTQLVVRSALELAESEFRLDKIRERFWVPIVETFDVRSRAC